MFTLCKIMHLNNLQIDQLLCKCIISLSLFTRPSFSLHLSLSLSLPLFVFLLSLSPLTHMQLIISVTVFRIVKPDVEPVYKGHPRETGEMAAVDRWPF